MMAFAVDKVYDTNLALATNGSSATASSGNAAAAIDGTDGTRWESAFTDDETWTLDMGQERIFTTIKIQWEGAYAKEFELSYSSDGDAWTNLYTETNLTIGNKEWQEIVVAETTARYIKYHGTLRATQWGQSFYEFQVLLPGESVLTSIEFSAATAIAKVGEGVNLTVKAKDQNGAEMDADFTYEITPADAGAVSGGKYIPAKVGNASIVAKSGTVQSAAIQVFGYEGNNLALSTNIATDNKVIDQSDFSPSGTDAFHAVDGNEGSVWQGSATNGTADSDEARQYSCYFTVDLGAFYTIDLITIHFEGACSQLYHIDFSEDNSVWNLGYEYIGAAGINGHTDYLSSQLNDNLKVRYVRFFSTKAATQYGMKIYEFQVFGRDYVASGDTEKPVMVSAALDSKTWNSAVISVSATDNDEVAKFHVVDATNSIDVKLAPVAGKITITNLAEATDYNFVITALDAANNESDNSMTVAVTTKARAIYPVAAAPVPTWPAAQVKSIYSDAYEFAPASLNSYCEGWWDAPKLEEKTIGEDHYLHYDLYRNGMIGAQFATISVAIMEKVHIDIFASASGSLTFRPITAGGPNTPKTLTLVGEQWNSFDIDLTEFAGHNWTALYQFAIEAYAAGGLVGEYISVDNIYFYRTTAYVDTEKPTNVTASLVAANYFGATLKANAEDNSGAVSFVVKNGDEVVGTGGAASGEDANIAVSGLLPNMNYTLSVIAKDDNGNEADAVEVEVETLVAPAAAPAPDFIGKVAIPVFCDALDNNPAINIGGWGQTTVAQFGNLVVGDKVCFGSNFNYLGWELEPAIDASEMEYVHVDFYATEMTSIQLTPISPGKEGTYNVNLTAGQWTSVDINLAQYTAANIDWSNIFQFKFMEATPSGKDLFIDNVYFFKESSATACGNVETETKAIKVLENGQLIIIKNGVRYNVQGAKIK